MFRLAAAGLAATISLQAALALAIVAAPNALHSAAATPPMALPSDLALRAGRPFRVALGPDERTLSTWIVEPPGREPKATIVMFHGVRMDKLTLVPMAIALSDAGYRAVLVDLPGHGESTGRLLSYGASESRDASRLLDALVNEGVARGPIGAYGFSYGAAVAIDWAARDSRVRSVVAVSPFASLREVIEDYRVKYLRHALGVVPSSWFQTAVSRAAWLNGFDPDAAAPLRSIARSAGPTLLIHGDADTQVPLRHSCELERASHAKAELFVLHGATHDSMPADRTRAIRARTVAWFDERLRLGHEPPHAP